jgi:hypothetical protein
MSLLIIVNKVTKMIRLLQLSIRAIRREASRLKEIDISKAEARLDQVLEEVNQ